ncbi:MAG: hypothetical protein Q9204_001792 [Flavoplaca sp. TL-2023a]
MTGEFRSFLAQQILSEGLIASCPSHKSLTSSNRMQVSYRNLSRELKVHSNVAKRLLFQFHKQQNAKKPGSIHAVYVFTGYTIPVAPPTASQNGTIMDGEDAHMQSSPFMSSSMPQLEEEEEQAAIKTVTLCREEDLEG